MTHPLQSIEMTMFIVKPYGQPCRLVNILDLSGCMVGQEGTLTSEHGTVTAGHTSHHPLHDMLVAMREPNPFAGAPLLPVQTSFFLPTARALMREALSLEQPTADPVLWAVEKVGRRFGLTRREMDELAEALQSKD